MDKKLYILSTVQRDTVIVGGIRNGSIFIQAVQTVRVRTTKEFTFIRSEMAKYKSRGFTVVVNEPLPRLSSGFTQCDLADTDESGQPKLIAALTAYQQLSQRKAIRFAEGCKKVDVPSNTYEKVIQDSGKTVYRIDWETISEEAVCLLTFVYNAIYHSSTEANFLKALFSEINNKRIKQKYYAGKKGGFL